MGPDDEENHDFDAAPPTVLDPPEAITAPHPIIPEVAQAFEDGRRQGYRDGFAAGQEDAVAALQEILAENFGADARIAETVAVLRGRMTPA